MCSVITVMYVVSRRVFSGLLVDMSLLQVLVPCSAQMAAQNASVQNSPAALLNQLVKAVLNEDEGKLHMF